MRVLNFPFRKKRGPLEGRRLIYVDFGRFWGAHGRDFCLNFLFFAVIGRLRWTRRSVTNMSVLRDRWRFPGLWIGGWWNNCLAGLKLPPCCTEINPVGVDSFWFICCAVSPAGADSSLHRRRCDDNPEGVVTSLLWLDRFLVFGLHVSFCCVNSIGVSRVT